MPKFPHIQSNRYRGYHGVHVLHSSRIGSRGKRRGWTVVDDSWGRLHPNRFISRNKAIRLFQHFMKGR